MQIGKTYAWPFLVLAALAPTARGETESGVRLSVGGTISNHLPRPRDDQRLLADYPAVGTARITTTQYCGDGDVAILSRGERDLEFVSSGNVSFVLGYWAVPSDSSNPIPTDSNWFPLGTGVLAAKNGDSETLNAIGKQGASESILGLVNESVTNLAATSGYRMSAASQQAFHVYHGVLMCKSITNPSSTSAKFPQPFTVSRSLQQSVLGAIDGALQTAAAISDVEKFKVSIDESGVNLAIGTGPNTIADDAFYKLGAAVMGLAFPAAATDTATYQQALDGVVWNQLAALHSQFYAKTSCYRADITGVENTGKFDWEGMPLQLTCLALSSYNGKTLDTLVKAFLMPATLPDEAGFLSARLELAKALTRAALMQQSQIAVSTTYTRPKDTCFVSNLLYVNKVMGSLPVNVGTTNASSSPKMLHPEGDFAMGKINSYKGTQGNYYTIFKMTKETFTPMVLTQGQTSTPGSVLTKSFLLRFNVRGIGCSGIVYCKNEKNAGGAVAQ